MNITLPPCPQCQSIYTYEDRGSLICPECAHEWTDIQDKSIQDDILVIKDAHGNILQSGDRATLIKDLKVKGSSTIVKIGTKVKILHLVEGDHNIDCRIDGIGPMMLKSEFVKKI